MVNARKCLKEGYPEIAFLNAKRVLLLCSESGESKDNIELRKISCSGRCYYAEALRAWGLPGLSALEYGKLEALMR